MPASLVRKEMRAQFGAITKSPIEGDGFWTIKDSRFVLGEIVGFDVVSNMVGIRLRSLCVVSCHVDELVFTNSGEWVTSPGVLGL
jgi:hypothetical protein